MTRAIPPPRADPARSKPVPAPAGSPAPPARAPGSSRLSQLHHRRDGLVQQGGDLLPGGDQLFGVSLLHLTGLLRRSSLLASGHGLVDELHQRLEIFGGGFDPVLALLQPLRQLIAQTRHAGGRVFDDVLVDLLVPVAVSLVVVIGGVSGALRRRVLARRRWFAAADGGRGEEGVEPGLVGQHAFPRSPVRSRAQKVPGAGTGVFRLDDLAVTPWYAEAPYLKTLVVKLVSPDDRTTDRIETRIGFRRVRVEGRDLLVNGRRVLIQSVNRHDVDPRTGRVMSHTTMLAELSLLKRFNGRTAGHAGAHRGGGVLRGRRVGPVAGHDHVHGFPVSVLVFSGWPQSTVTGP
ncbi:glycoside hydrolase family 2 TIM barrel-domain containing protein [Nonomuraea bangladeshensis]